MDIPKTMSEQKIQTPEHGYDQKSVERAIRIFDAIMDDTTAPELRSRMIEWFLSPSNWDAKGKALEEYMHRRLAPASAPDRRTLRAKEAFMRELGIAPAAPVTPATGRNPRLYRRIYLRVAAAAAVLILAVSGAYLGGVFRSGTVENVMAQVETIVVEALEGVQKQIVLPCGSTVLLNAGSRLSYPSAIVNSERHVKLEGEAWFDVIHDVARPFLVSTDKLEIMVLGTKFNVNTSLTNTSVRLDEGTVEVRAGERTMKLEPGQELHYDSETGEMLVDKASNNEDSGNILITGKTIQEILRMADSFYGTKIHFETSDFNDDDEYSINLNHDQSLENVLEVLSIISNGFTFERQDDGSVKIICKK